ncbi:hypothetical protein [Sphingopyxis sp. GW247-27LB]|uniref:hypothetical protein n=1 Tax=Sphingopyxis sp. GW247-27LB TaxID=2012632 RepID=UPI000BA580A2|nr:hypothetical protein [Sphingopyxis sp. GW247-27LB]PAL23580.1 hypothetical protein CD928_05800 [Sphingopyxis sp. GW247-27LB]
MIWGNNYIAARITDAGLLFTASNAGRADLASAAADGGYYRAESEVCENIGGNGLEPVPPEMLGLTDMPAFSCGLTWDAEENRAWDGEGCPIWGFPDYQIRDPWAELRRRGRVIFPIVGHS